MAHRLHGCYGMTGSLYFIDLNGCDTVFEVDQDGDVYTHYHHHVTSSWCENLVVDFWLKSPVEHLICLRDEFDLVPLIGPTDDIDTTMSADFCTGKPTCPCEYCRQTLDTGTLK